MTRALKHLAIVGFLMAFWVSTAKADLIVVTETFFTPQGTTRLIAYDTASGGSSSVFAEMQMRFATQQSFPVVSGITYDSTSDRIYVTELDRATLAHGRVHVLNGAGNVLGFHDFDFATAGVAVSSQGVIYLSDLGTNTIRRFNSAFGSAGGDFTVDGAANATGLAFRGDDLYISTLGDGVFLRSNNNVTSFNIDGRASGQIALDQDGNVYVGHGPAASNFAHKFAANGQQILNSDSDPFLEVTFDMVGGTGGSTPGTGPAGLAFDSDGNLVVAVLGAANPFTDGFERGGLFLFNKNGEFISEFASNTRSYSGVIVISAIPEPGGLLLLGIGGIALATRRRR